jgi:hypothetical protein
MNNVFVKCPACSGGLYASQLNCSECDTTVRGSFALSAFDRLSSESLRFLEIYVRNRGNLKEMERELGQSYQNLRSRLNRIIGEMGFEVGIDTEVEGGPGLRRQAILEQLDQGEIDAASAAEELAKLK